MAIRKIRVVEEHEIRTDGEKFCASGVADHCEAYVHVTGRSESYPVCIRFRHGSDDPQELAVNRDGQPIRCSACRQAEQDYIAAQKGDG